MDRRSKLASLIFISALVTQPAFADCSSPAAVEGAREYTSGVFKLCDGTNWVSFSTDGTLGACTGAGKMDYDDTAGAYKYCDNSNWHKIKKTSSCTVSSLTYKSKVTSSTYLDAANMIRLSSDGTKAYVIGQWTSRFAVYDISTSPAAPTFVGSVTNANLNDTSDMQIFGNYAFVIARNTDNLVVVDISNPASPSYVTRVQSSPTNQMANVWGVGLSEDGKHAFAVSWGSGAGGNKCYFNSFDISTPTSPSYVGALNITDGGSGGYEWCNKVLVKGNYAFVSFGDGALIVVDISNPASPSYVAKVEHSNAANIETMDFSEDQKYIFATSNNAANRFTVFNVSNPASPSYVTSLQNASYWNTAFGVKVVGKYAFTGGAGSNSLAVVDVSNPSSPSVVASYTSATNIGGATDVRVNGQYVYVIGNSIASLAVIDMGCDPGNPSLGSCTTAKQIDYFSATKTLAYCDGSKWRPMTP